MDKFFIITNDLKDKNMRLTGKITAYLRERGRTCLVRNGCRENPGAGYRYTNPEDVYKRQ